MIQRPAFVETPREALDARRKLLNWWKNPEEPQIEWLRQVFPRPPQVDQGSDHRSWLREVAAREAVILAYGGLYLISDEMTEVARAAALTLPSFVLAKEDFPAESGLMIFDHSPASYKSTDGEVGDFIAATWWWGHINGHAGVLFQWYEDRDGGILAPREAQNEAQIREVNRQLLPRLTPASWTLIPFGEDFSSLGGDKQNGKILMPVVAALLLMQQPLAAIERSKALPLDARRARRAGIADSDVTVIKLRHMKTQSGVDIIRPREYRNRWIVRGHWRNQWMPSRGVHRPTWINAHIKGPEDAPIRVKEKVNVWSR